LKKYRTKNLFKKEGFYMTKTYENVLFEVKNGIAAITLNREEMHNAMTVDMYSDILDAIKICDKDDDVRCVVITGVGKHFCAGGDLKRFKGYIEQGIYLYDGSIEAAGRMVAGIRRCGKPVIAMVNGTANGAGAGLALACDFRFMSPKSKLIMGFINLGVPGDTVSIYSTLHLAGLTKGMEIMMTGDPINGDEAYRLGLATRCVDEEQLKSETNAFAQRMARAATFAIRKQKEILMEYFYNDIDSFLVKEVKNMMESAYQRHDFQEAVYAYLDKRAPDFTGK